MKDYLILTDEGKEVKGLKPDAMSIEDVVIPEGVERIADLAFEGNKSLKSIHLPGSITFIGVSAFAECSSLQTINLPQGITVLCASLFANCSALRDIVLPSKLKEIETGCFYGCSALESLALPESVEKIDELVFYGCTHLRSINIPLGALLWRNNHFLGCDALTDLQISPEHPQYIAEQGFFTNLEGTTIIASWTNGVGRHCAIPEGIITIGEQAFEGCKMESIDLPSSITEIGSRAFAECKKLKSVVLPEKVKEVMFGTFEDCTSLTEVIISENTHEIYDHAFQGCSSLQRVSAPVEIGVFLGNSSFAQCTNLSRLDNLFIGDVDDYAFEDCESLASLDNMIGGTIGTQAFAGCKSLRTFTIVPDCFENFELDGVDDLYFDGVDLEQCELRVEDDRFDDCINHTLFGQFGKIVSQKRILDNVENVLTDLDTGEVLLIDRENPIRRGEFWPDYLLYSLDGRKVVGVNPDFDLSDLPVVIIPEGIEIIGHSAFSRNQVLHKVHLPNSLKLIDAGAFWGCSCLTEINFPDNLSVIESAAFAYCSSLKNIQLPSSLSEIGAGCFIECSSLTSVEIPEHVTDIGSHAFFDCQNLRNINIPIGTRLLGNSHFVYCPNLIIDIHPDHPQYDSINGFITNLEHTSIIHALHDRIDNHCVIPYGYLKIDEGAFSGCLMSEVVFPQSIAEIAANAFEGCYHLTRLENLPPCVIGNRAFRDCCSIPHISLSGTNISDFQIDEFAFDSGTYTDGTLTVDSLVVDECKAHPILGQFKTIIGVTDDIFFGSSYPEEENPPF